VFSGRLDVLLARPGRSFLGFCADPVKYSLLVAEHEWYFDARIWERAYHIFQHRSATISQTSWSLHIYHIKSLNILNQENLRSLRHFNMGCGFSRIAGDTSVDTDDIRDAPVKYRKKKWKGKPQQDTGTLQTQRSVCHDLNTEPKISNKQKVSAFVGTPDQYWRNRGASAAGGPMTAGPSMGLLL
jgi:hypothetical protein